MGNSNARASLGLLSLKQAKTICVDISMHLPESAFEVGLPSREDLSSISVHAQTLNESLGEPSTGNVPSFNFHFGSERPVEDSVEVESPCILGPKCDSHSCASVLDIGRSNHRVRVLKKSRFFGVFNKCPQFQTQQRPRPLLARVVEKTEEYLLRASRSSCFFTSIGAAKINRPPRARLKRQGHQGTVTSSLAY